MSQLAYMESVSAESVLLLIILQYHLGQGPFFFNGSISF